MDGVVGVETRVLVCPYLWNENNLDKFVPDRFGLSAYLSGVNAIRVANTTPYK